MSDRPGSDKPRHRPASTMSRSLDLLRREGYIAGSVECYIAAVGHHADLWGFGDIVAAHPVKREILIVQTTSAGHVSDRLAKARSKPELAVWLKAGGTFQVFGWKQIDGRWRVRRVAVQPEDLAAVEVQSLPRRRRKAKTPNQRNLFACDVQYGADFGTQRPEVSSLTGNGGAPNAT